jgi:periplasmic protein TonB
MPPLSDSSRYQACCIFSLLLHGTAFGVSLLLFSNLRLAEQPEPFRWNVGVVDQLSEPTSQPVSPTGVSPTTQAPLQRRPASRAENKVARAAPPPVVESRTPAAPTPKEETSDTQPLSPQMRPERESAGVQQAVQRPVEEFQRVASSPEAPPPPQPTVSDQSTHAAAQSDLRAHADAREPSPSEGSSSGRAPRSPSQLAQEEAQAPASRPLPDELHGERHPSEIASLEAPGPPENWEGEATVPPSVQKARQDFGWLGEALRNRLQQSHKYSTVARLNGLEGRVVLRVTVRENGELLVALGKSSGHDVLDRDAVEAVQRLSPLTLHHPLGRTQQSLNLPITYTLDR